MAFQNYDSQLYYDNVFLSKGDPSRFLHLDKLTLMFSTLSFVIRVNLLHP